MWLLLRIILKLISLTVLLIGICQYRQKCACESLEAQAEHDDNSKAERKVVLEKQITILFPISILWPICSVFIDFLVLDSACLVYSCGVPQKKYRTKSTVVSDISGFKSWPCHLWVYLCNFVWVPSPCISFPSICKVEIYGLSWGVIPEVSFC